MGTSTLAPGDPLDALPQNIAFKAATTQVDAPGIVSADERTGRIVALTSVTGIADSVNDIIEPGAYTETLKKRRPKVCWNHSWEQPIGRVTDIVELHPGDPRLPKQTKDGKPWPQAAGALLTTMELNMESERGREAYSAIRFFAESNEAEFSIGYTVTKSLRDKANVRHIKSLELYEVSFVLFGAAPLSMALSVKDSLAEALERKAAILAGGYDPALESKYDDSPMGSATNGESWVERAGGLPPFVRALARGIMKAGHSKSQAIAIAIGTVKRWARGGGNVTAKTRAKAAAAVAQWEAAKARAHAKKSADATALIDHILDMDDTFTDGWTDEQWAEVDALADDIEGKDGYDPDLDVKAAQPKFGDGVMVAVYPPADTAAGLAHPGGLAGDELHVTLAYLGRTTDEVTTGGTLGDAADRIVAAVGNVTAAARPLTGTVGGLGRFPAGDDGTPVWVPVDVPGLSGVREAIVTALTGAGLPVSQSHGFAPHLTLGYDLDVTDPVDSAPVDFAHVAVVVGGDRYDLPLGGPAPTSAGAMSGTKAAVYSPTLDAAGAVKAVGYDPSLDFTQMVADGDGLSGSLEERLRAVRDAVRDRYSPRLDRYEPTPARLPHRWASVVATWDDRVIVVVDGEDRTGAYARLVHEVPYTLTAGAVTLGEAVEVRAHVTFEGGSDTTDATPDDLVTHNAADALEEATKSLGALWVDSPEVKAGRVLSAGNVDRVRQAAENLIAVLRAAGVDISRPDPDDGHPVDPALTDTSTTSSSVRADTKTAPVSLEVKAVDVEALLASLRS